MGSSAFPGRVSLPSSPRLRLRRWHLNRRFYAFALIFCTVTYLVLTHNASTLSARVFGSGESWASSTMISSRRDPLVARGLRYDVDGLVKGWDALHGPQEQSKLSKRDKSTLRDLRRKHPIEELVKLGLERWNGLVTRWIEPRFWTFDVDRADKSDQTISNAEPGCRGI